MSNRIHSTTVTLSDPLHYFVALTTFHGIFVYVSHIHSGCEKYLEIPWTIVSPTKHYYGYE